MGSACKLLEFVVGGATGRDWVCRHECRHGMQECMRYGRMGAVGWRERFRWDRSCLGAGYGIWGDLGCPLAALAGEG